MEFADTLFPRCAPARKPPPVPLDKEAPRRAAAQRRKTAGGAGACLCVGRSGRSSGRCTREWWGWPATEQGGRKGWAEGFRRTCNRHHHSWVPAWLFTCVCVAVQAPPPAAAVLIVLRTMTRPVLPSRPLFPPLAGSAQAAVKKKLQAGKTQPAEKSVLKTLEKKRRAAEEKKEKKCQPKWAIGRRADAYQQQQWAVGSTAVWSIIGSSSGHTLSAANESKPAVAAASVRSSVRLSVRSSPASQPDSV